MTDDSYETTTVPLINHALQAMLNEHGAQGWELVGVDGDTATMRRSTTDPTPWEYATVPLVPAARQAILDQWTSMGYELVLEVETVAYLKRAKETTR